VNAKNVTVRLDHIELSALRELPGATDAERLRNLIRSVGATDGLSLKISSTVKMGIIGEFSKLSGRIEAAEMHIITENKSLIDKLVSQLNKPFTEILDHIRGTEK